MSMDYYLGVAAGAVCAVVLIIVLIRVFKVRRVKPQYDERQIAAQGRAFKLAFITLTVWCGLYGLLDAFGVRWCDTAATGLFLGIIVSAGVYAVSAVLNDAYFGYNESVSSVRLLIALGALNLFTALMTVFADGEHVVHDGVVQGTPTLSFAIAILFAVLLIVNRVHGKKLPKEDAE